MPRKKSQLGYRRKYTNTGGNSFLKKTEHLGSEEKKHAESPDNNYPEQDLLQIVSPGVCEWQQDIRASTSSGDVLNWSTTSEHEDIQHFHHYPDFFLPDIGNDKKTDLHGELCDYEGSYANEFFLVTDIVIKISPTDDTDYFRQKRIKDQQLQRYNDLHQVLKNDAMTIQAETNFILLPSSEIQFVQVYNTQNPSIKCVVRILPETFSSVVIVHRHLVSEHHELWKCIPNLCTTSQDVVTLLCAVSKFGVCVGNPDFTSFEPGAISFRESNVGAVCGNFFYDETIRHNNCLLLTHGLRCQKCIDLRGALRKRKSLQNKKSPNTSNLISSRTRHDKMTKAQICKKVNILQKNRYAMAAKLKSLKMKLQKAIDKCSTIGKSTTLDVQQMAQDCSDYVKAQFPDENSFQRLFWEEQMKYNNAKSPSSMRWHPMIIKWCLQIKGRSTKAYETLRNLGFIKLPSNRTLYDYTHFMKSQGGISNEITNHLITECEAKGIYDVDWKTYVGLLQDEIKIKEDLVYDKHSGEIIGFTNLDSTGNQLAKMENEMNKRPMPLAKYMLVVMVRGIGTNLMYPLTCYATDGITAESLYPIIYKNIQCLEVHVGLKVLFVTCDGASPNRRFFAMHGSDETFSTPNPYAPDRNILFISDVPHLIKTCRNCFANSYSHSCSRKLWNNGKYITWMHIVDLYNDSVKRNLLTYCPKLTKQHVDLDSHSKMNVNLAAQVLSSTVAKALEHLYGEEVSETVRFIQYMNKFFDIMNTRNLHESHRKRNANLAPFVSPDDERLTWLQCDFLKYFREWEENVKNRVGDFSNEERNRMQLSQQTLHGLRISVQSIVELVKFALSKGIPFVMTSVFNQDPLEQQFGHCRHMGGSNENPRAYDMQYSMTRLRVMGSTALALSGGNTKRPNETQNIDFTPLQKRRSVRSEK